MGGAIRPECGFGYVPEIATDLDAQYDFPAYDAGKDSSEFQTLVALAVRSGRAIGIIVTRERVCEWRASLPSFEQGSLGQWRPTNAEHINPHRRRAIGFIWVLKKYRGQGILDRLVRDLQTQLNQPLEELAHESPFRRSGSKVLAEARARRYLCGVNRVFTAQQIKRHESFSAPRSYTSVEWARRLTSW